MSSHPARWWHREPDGKLLCTLCPRFCRLSDGQAGFCYIRKAEHGRLVSLGYGRTTGFAVDPIEKKPLNHFLPGTSVLSFGTAGCNLGCKFCQNWDISKARLDDTQSAPVTAEEVVELAIAQGCPSVAMTYNDPVIWAEFAVDIARAARVRGVRAVLVSAGYVTEEARGELFADIDAANIDLKAFTDDFYHRVTFAHLQPVLETLRWLKRETKVWLEITNLMIPGLNDSEDETRKLCEWIGAELGDRVPLHFTAFHPDFKLRDRPPTPAATLVRARELAREIGLRHVYTGNVRDRQGGTTFCLACGAAVIARDGYAVDPRGLVARDGVGHCAACDARVDGVFDLPLAASPGRRRSLGLVTT
ncbi:MAG TPA: AmmeMemoRadiSam system radical SAM enzyme [Polyangia bacterium]|jgi:pyruvate formate lyase activating enzyme|nr:AmmeMemoRadiSam system radical SAM enzyme [Polyangia bacterium]